MFSIVSLVFLGMNDQAELKNERKGFARNDRHILPSLLIKRSSGW